MPIPSNGQEFVKPQSGGTGGWMAKLFGGIADDRRARQMAQIQFDLHQARAGVDTEHQAIRVKTRVAAETAGKDYLGEQQQKRAHGSFDFYTKDRGIDVADISRISPQGIDFQKKGLENRKPSATAVDENATAETPGTNPTRGGTKGNKPSAPRKKQATIKDTEAALSLAGSKKKLGKKQTLSNTYQINGKTVTEQPGTAPRLGLDTEAGANISTNFAAKLGRQSAADNINGGGDGGGNGGVTPPKTRKPSTPKADA
jgi:hypothetical protein